MKRAFSLPASFLVADCFKKREALDVSDGPADFHYSNTLKFRRHNHRPRHAIFERGPEAVTARWIRSSVVSNAGQVKATASALEQDFSGGHREAV